MCDTSHAQHFHNVESGGLRMVTNGFVGQDQNGE